MNSDISAHIRSFTGSVPLSVAVYCSYGTGRGDLLCVGTRLSPSGQVEFKVSIPFVGLGESAAFSRKALTALCRASMEVDAEQYMEGFHIVVFRGTAKDVPFVCTDIFDVQKEMSKPDLIHYKGFLCMKESFDSMLDWVLEVLE